MLGRVNYSTAVNLIQWEPGKETKSKLKNACSASNSGFGKKEPF